MWISGSWWVGFRANKGGIVGAICSGIWCFSIVVISFIGIGTGIVIVEGLKKGFKSFGLVMQIG